MPQNSAIFDQKMYKNNATPISIKQFYIKNDEEKTMFSKNERIVFWKEEKKEKHFLIVFWKR